MTDPLDRVLAHIERNFDASLDRLCAFLRIPSVGKDPECANACRDAADWLVSVFSEAGFDAQAYPTDGHPLVICADRSAGPDRPTILFYGHYDLQPAGSPALWIRDPFDPWIENQDLGEDGRARIVARGASDDKGNLMTFVEAILAWKASEGALPINVVVMIEGDEEASGGDIEKAMKQHEARLAADLAFICDCGLWGRDRPALVTSLRGLLSEEITVRGPKMDLHSGTYGPAARNPIHVLTDMLAAMRDADGTILIPGFYDGVPELTQDDLDRHESLAFDDQRFLSDVGLSHPATNDGYGVLASTWYRPTLEVNGISGGYSGPGGMTIIPSTATAKISCRLVGDQEPECIRLAIRRFVEDRCPSDCTVHFTEQGAEKGALMPVGGPLISKVSEALEEEWQAPIAHIGEGGSIPVARYFQELFCIDVVVTGFVLEDDLAHSPNERFELRSYRKGIRSIARIIGRVADTAAS